MSDPLDVQTLSAALPEWLRARTQPPWLTTSDWQSMPEQDRQAVLDQEQQGWVDWLHASPAHANGNIDALTEATTIFFNGLSNEGLMAQHPILPGDAGRGVVGDWERLQTPGAPAAQYFNLTKLFGAGFANPHFNLCGELSVISLLGLGVEAGLRSFMNVPSQSDNDDILADPQRGTLGRTLASFIDSASQNQLHAEFERLLGDPHAPLFSPEQLLALLDTNAKLVVLLNIDGDGKLKPLQASVKKIAHWAGLLDVIVPRRGDKIVRIYNPFPNREEFYTWTNFSSAWKATNGNQSRFGTVVARMV